jgi:protein phosphatase
VGANASAYRSGDLLADRFLCKRSHIFLDTKPGLPPTNFFEVPDWFLPYLRLSPYQLHIPQVYDWLQFDSPTPEATLLFLDQAPLYLRDSLIEHGINPGDEPTESDVQIFPQLESAWQQAPPLRQLHWLWQIANLWQPLSSEQLAATLLTPDLVRVEGGLLRILELNFAAGRSTPTLTDLGQYWSQWIENARPELQRFLQQLCQQLIGEQIYNSEILIERLDSAIALVAQSQTRQIQIATRTDQGPTRQRNEDACYPASGTVERVDQSSLVIVCDGIGGHQGGDVASHLAIEAVEQRATELLAESLDPNSLTIELERAACLANDLISERNDSENRLDRQRMGTTLVMGLIRNHELYVTHVGDSRAYWITRWGCHQITVDDDVASREVRLGFNSYRQALQQPSSGSLVQALGMGASSMLYPNVQRFLLDEDSIFLLCSDGLSDNDRVEESWEAEILPLLDGKTDLLTIGHRLIEIGNTRNGYDNVTVGLIYCQVKDSHPIPTLPDLPSIEQPTTLPPQSATAVVAPLNSDPRTSTVPLSSHSTEKTRIISPPSTQPRLLPLLLGIVALLGVAAGLSYFLFPELFPDLFSRFNRTATRTDPSPLQSSVPVSPTPSTSPLTALEISSLLQVQPAQTPSGTAAIVPVLQSRPAAVTDPALPPAEPAVSLGRIFPGTVLEVVSKQGATAQDQWVQLRVCSTPEAPAPGSSNSSAASPTSPEATPTSPLPTILPGQIGWIEEGNLLPIVTLIPNQSDAQRRACVQPTPAQPTPAQPTPAQPTPTASPSS